MKNNCGRAARCSITAAPFLQRFVGKYAVAHLDIADGIEESHRPRKRRSGTGFVRAS